VDDATCGYRQVESRENDIHLRELVLLPAYQNHGIGTTILLRLQAQARERAVPVRLGTLLQNDAVRLYQRIGFRELERTQTLILMEWRPPTPAAGAV